MMPEAVGQEMGAEKRESVGSGEALSEAVLGALRRLLCLEATQ
jgi:hypothetical protein